jgi:DNA primase
MIAARSHGVPAIALPGTDSWKDEWAVWFAGREVAVVMDCDRQGRAVATRIADALAGVTVVKIVDLAPERDDGYDLTDWILGGTPCAETIDLGGSVKAGAGDGG